MTFVHAVLLFPIPWSLFPAFLRRYRDRLGLQGQRLLAQRLKEHAGQVALAEVGQDDHNQLTRALRPRRNFQCGSSRGSRADA